MIYRAICTCGLEYVGKTTRKFRRRVGEHLGDIRHQRDTAIAHHIWASHEGDPNALRFMAIDKIPPNLRRGDLDKVLLQKETFWIFTLKSVSPGGPNEQLTYTCFILCISAVILHQSRQYLKNVLSPNIINNVHTPVVMT